MPQMPNAEIFSAMRYEYYLHTNSRNQIFEDNRIRTNVSLDELHDLHYKATSMSLTAVTKGVFKGGGFRGFKPPPEIFRFFFEKGRKRDRKKKKKKGWGGGGYLLTYFWG